MNLTIFTGRQETAHDPLTIDPRSLSQAFEQVRDGRKRRGKRYPLALILTLVLLGKLAAETTISGIVEWIRLRERWLRAQLNWPRGFPRPATSIRAVAGCDAEELARVIAAVLLKARSAEQERAGSSAPALRQVAVDGKTLRGTLGHQQEHQPRASPLVV